MPHHSATNMKQILW